MGKLKPCFRCGEPAEYEVHQFTSGQSHEFQCSDNDCDMDVYFRGTYEDAVRRYNDRPIEDRLNKRIKELEDQLEDEIHRIDS